MNSNTIIGIEMPTAISTCPDSGVFVSAGKKGEDATSLSAEFDFDIFPVEEEASFVFVDNSEDDIFSGRDIKPTEDERDVSIYKIISIRQNNVIKIFAVTFTC